MTMNEVVYAYITNSSESWRAFWFRSHFRRKYSTAIYTFITQ